MTVTAHQPYRFARAIRAACNNDPWEPGCNYPQCQADSKIGCYVCWFALDIDSVKAAIEEWERPQHLADSQ